LTSRFSPRAVLFEGWRTVRPCPSERPRGASSSRVRLVIVSSRVDLLRCQSFAPGGLSDCPCRATGLFAWKADCPPGEHGLSTRHELLADCPKTRYGPSTCLGARLVVLLRLTDRPPVGSGPFAPGSRTVREGVRRTAKSFSSLSFVFALGSFGVCS
jgi:hypothetical protein